MFFASFKIIKSLFLRQNKWHKHIQMQAREVTGFYKRERCTQVSVKTRALDEMPSCLGLQQHNLHSSNKLFCGCAGVGACDESEVLQSRVAGGRQCQDPCSLENLQNQQATIQGTLSENILKSLNRFRFVTKPCQGGQ